MQECLSKVQAIDVGNWPPSMAKVGKMGYTTRDTYLFVPDPKLWPCISIRRFDDPIGSIESSNLGTLELAAITSCRDGA